MTVLDALNVEVNNQVLSNKYLVLVGLDPVTVYSPDNNEDVDLAKAYAFKAIVTQPDWSEDGLNIKYDRNYLIKEADRIFKLNDLLDEIINASPTVSDSTRLW